MVMSNKSEYYKYKYFKYKNKYFNLKNAYQQNGGKVISTISKSNLETAYFLDFELGSKVELIDTKYIIDDVSAIDFINNYDYYIDELEQEEIEMQKQQEEQGINESEDYGEDVDNYIYPEESEEDDIINSLHQIDIATWNPVNKTNTQYYLVKITNDDTNYLLKLVGSDYKYEFNRNMEEYGVEYGKLKNMKNILSPQFLFKDANNIISGYLLKFNEDLISLGDYLKSNNLTDKIFLQIVNKICDCFINIMRCGLKPCAKNNKAMILNLDNGIEVFLTGIDGLLACNQDIEEETVRDIAKFFDVEQLSRELRQSYLIKKIFKVSDTELSLKNNIVTIRGLKELVEKLINS